MIENNSHKGVQVVRMEQINWDYFQSDKDILEYLRGLPRYTNTPVKSAFRRAMFFVNLLYCRLFKVNKPLFIVLVTNNSCNLNCKYCYGSYGERRQKDPSTKELLKIIDELKDLGTKLLTVHGGESLLRKDIEEILNYIKLKGFYVSLNTNGYLITKKMHVLRCVDAICISMDGSEENNDRTRGKGSFQHAMQAIDIILENKLPLVVSATLTKLSIQDIEYLTEMGKNRGFRVQYHILYKQNMLYSEKMRKAFAELAISDAEIRESVRKILQLKEQGHPVYWSENVLKTAVDWPASYDKNTFFTKNDKVTIKHSNLIPCYHGRLKYQIDADGRVFTCWDRTHSDAPNVKEVGVAEAIKHCHDKDDCLHCAFLANNEHNALMQLSFKTIWNILRIQVADALKIKTPSEKKHSSSGIQTFEVPESSREVEKVL